ncbi:MAG TPA: glycosyltransferase family 2 protein [Thermoanaerobaculia bacterium]|nr:glycosyltransferase family 2 protein [Thermoanaerobaculia bacterium]
MTDVDLIVLDIDGGAMLAECIESIREQSVPPRSIIVFDNGSRVPVRLDGVEVLRSETNLGFARAANEAFRHTRAPYVGVVNNDVVLDSDWLAHVRDALDRDAQLAAVQTIIRRPDGAIDGAGIDISDGTFRQIGYGQPVGSPLAVAWGVSATATLYRASALGERPFDERLFAYYEDVELSARLRAGGWRTAVLPVIKATHRGSMSAPVLGGDALRLRTRNRYLVARQHRGAGRIRALLWEDARLALRGRTSLRGVVEGLCSRL